MADKHSDKIKIEPTPEDADEPLFKAVVSMESKLSLPKGFSMKLYEEDDWSFIIKIHALLEAAVSHLLSEHFPDPKPIRAISRLELSNTRTGKLAFVGEMDLLEKKHRRCVHELSEIRNMIVHDIKNANFALSDYIAGMKGEKRKNFVSSFDYMWKERFTITDTEVVREKFCLENPKLSILLAVFDVLFHIYISTERAELSKRWAEIAQRHYELSRPK